MHLIILEGIYKRFLKETLGHFYRGISLRTSEERISREISKEIPGGSSERNFGGFSVEIYGRFSEEFKEILNF